MDKTKDMKIKDIRLHNLLEIIREEPRYQERIYLIDQVKELLDIESVNNLDKMFNNPLDQIDNFTD